MFVSFDRISLVLNQCPLCVRAQQKPTEGTGGQEEKCLGAASLACYKNFLLCLFYLPTLYSPKFFFGPLFSFQTQNLVRMVDTGSDVRNLENHYEMTEQRGLSVAQNFRVNCAEGEGRCMGEKEETGCIHACMHAHMHAHKLTHTHTYIHTKRKRD